MAIDIDLLKQNLKIKLAIKVAKSESHGVGDFKESESEYIFRLLMSNFFKDHYFFRDENQEIPDGFHLGTDFFLFTNVPIYDFKNMATLILSKSYFA